MAPMRPTTRPASGNAQAALAMAPPAIGVARKSGSRVQKIRLAWISSARASSQLLVMVIVGNRHWPPIVLNPVARDPCAESHRHGEFYLIFGLARALSRSAERASRRQRRGGQARSHPDQAAEEPWPARRSVRLACTLAGPCAAAPRSGRNPGF